MRIRLKWVMLAIVALMFVKNIVQNSLDERPIKFESYKTGEEFEKKLRSEFPNGTDLDSAIKILEQSGAKCKSVVIDEPERVFFHRYGHSIPKHAVDCTYTSYFFSFTSIIDYRNYYVSLHADANRKIVYCGGGRVGGVWVI